MPLDVDAIAALGHETNAALAAMLDGDATAVQQASSGCGALYGNPMRLCELAFVHRFAAPAGPTAFVAEFWEAHAPRLIDRIARSGELADSFGPLIRSEREAEEAAAFARGQSPVDAYLHETEEGWFWFLYEALCQVPPADLSALRRRLPAIERRIHASLHARLLWGQLQLAPTETLIVLHLDRPEALLVKATDVTTVGRLHLHLGVRLSQRPAWRGWTDGWQLAPWLVKRETTHGPPPQGVTRTLLPVKGCLEWSSWFRVGPQAEGAGDGHAGCSSAWLDASLSLAHIPPLHGHRVLRVRTQPSDFFGGDVPWPLSPRMNSVRSLPQGQVARWHARVHAAHRDRTERRRALEAELHHIGQTADIWAGRYSSVPQLRVMARALHDAWGELGDGFAPVDELWLKTIIGNLHADAAGNAALDDAVALALRHDLLASAYARRAVQWRARRFALASDLPGLHGFVTAHLPRVRAANPGTAATLLELLAQALTRAGDLAAARGAWSEFADAFERVAGPEHTRVAEARRVSAG